MTIASKGPCATITPSDSKAGKLGKTASRITITTARSGDKPECCHIGPGVFSAPRNAEHPLHKTPARQPAPPNGRPPLRNEQQLMPFPSSRRMNLSRPTQSAFEPMQIKDTKRAASLPLFPSVKFGSSCPNCKTAVPFQSGSGPFPRNYWGFRVPPADPSQRFSLTKAVCHAHLKAVAKSQSRDTPTPNPNFGGQFPESHWFDSDFGGCPLDSKMSSL